MSGIAVLGRLLAWLRAAPVTVRGSRPSPAARSSLVYAAAAGPVLVRVSGDPFGRGGGQLGRVVAAALEAEMTGLPVRFTADPGQAPRPEFRVVVAFDPVPSATPGEVCAGTAAWAPRSGRLTVLAVFCGTGEVLASATGRTAAVTAPDDPRFGRLVGQLAHALFDQQGW